MGFRRAGRCCGFAVAIVLALAVAAPQAQAKKKKEQPTQTLPLLPDPPPAVAAETARLSFHLSHLTTKGLLTPQTEAAVKELIQASHGGRIVKLRAFVAGTGDARRVRAIVSEIFNDKKRTPPALTTIQVGALPLDGAQVVIESVSEEKGDRPVNPNGLVFLAAQHSSDLKDSLAKLSAAAKDASVAPADVLQVTCFLGDPGQVEAAPLSEAAQIFPAAALNVVGRLREPTVASADCEAVGRRSEAGGEAVDLRPAAALVNTPKLVFSGSQMAFHATDAELRLAFERMGKSLEGAGGKFQDAVFAHFYPLQAAVQQKLPGLEKEFVLRAVPETDLIFEGLPSLDASMAMDVVAAVRN